MWSRYGAGSDEDRGQRICVSRCQCEDNDRSESVPQSRVHGWAPDAAVAKHDSQSDEEVITIQVIGFNAETVDCKNSKGATLR